MDAQTYYEQLVLHFPQERRLIADYSKLIAPNHSEMHSLSWSDRDKIEDIEMSKLEVEKLDRVSKDLKAEYEQLQHEITNIKISQSMRRSQIARLSGLSQPVEFDQTFFFADRHPSTPGSDGLRGPSHSGGKQGSSSSSSSSSGDPGSARGGGVVGRAGMLRTGETVILESRLDDVTKLIQGQFHLFATKLSSINLAEAPSSSAASPGSQTASIHTPTPSAAASCTRRAALRKDAFEILQDLEKKEEQLFATIIELLRLRLRMMVAQREEVEDREVLREEKTAYQRKESCTMHDLDRALTRNKQQFEKDLKQQLSKYQRQLQKSTKKLGALESFDQRKATAQKDRRLELRLQAAKTRYERLCERHELELEGYANEAKELKRKLAHAQRMVAHM